MKNQTSPFGRKTETQTLPSLNMNERKMKGMYYIHSAVPMPNELVEAFNKAHSNGGIDKPFYKEWETKAQQFWNENKISK